MKFILRVFLFLALLVIAGVMALRFLVPRSRLQAFAEQQIGRRLHREVSLEGVTPGLSGLGIAHLRLSEEPNFRAGTFLLADDIHLRWSLGTWLRSLHWGSFLPSQWDGKLYLGNATTPYYAAHHLKVEWHLTGVDRSLRRLEGSASLRQGPGLVKDLGRLQRKGKSLALFLLPLDLMQSVGQLGLSQLGLPNLNHWTLDRVTGDYRFIQGVMKIDAFKIASKEMGMSATGDIVLSSHRIAVTLALHSPQNALGGAMDLKVNLTGTLEHPQADLSTLKKQAFKATVQTILTDPKIRRDLQERAQKIFH